MVCILLGPHPFELLLHWHLILEFDALVHCEGSHRVSAIWMRHWAYSRSLGTDLVLLLSSFGAFFLFELLLYLCPREEGEEASEELGIFSSLVSKLQDKTHHNVENGVNNCKDESIVGSEVTTTELAKGFREAVVVTGSDFRLFSFNQHQEVSHVVAPALHVLSGQLNEGASLLGDAATLGIVEGAGHVLGWISSFVQ